MSLGVVVREILCREGIVVSMHEQYGESLHTKKNLEKTKRNGGI